MPGKPQAKNTFDAAFEQAQQWQEEAEVDRQKMNRKNWDLYLAILLRADNPEPDDARELAQMMTDYGISPEQVQEDRKTVNRAVMWSDRHSKKDQLSKKSSEASQEYRELVKRHEEEEREAYRKKNIAEGHSRNASQARLKLYSLQRKRPEFFEDGDPPQLIKNWKHWLRNS